jgi:hypothetical protein
VLGNMAWRRSRRPWLVGSLLTTVPDSPHIRRQAQVGQRGALRPLVRPCGRPHVQKPRTRRVRRVLDGAAIDVVEADAGVTATNGAGSPHQLQFRSELMCRCW